MFEQWLERKLQERESHHLLRRLVNTQGLIDFTSNDYLGLAHSDELFQNIADRVAQLNLRNNGAGGSRMLSGNSVHAEEIENKLADIFHGEAALIFNSGYTANLAVLSSLPQRNDTILYDERAHACMKDGARLSLAHKYSFKHNDLADLSKKLQKASGRIYVAVESVYSMDGDECPLKELIELTEHYNASVILDEAHSTGIVGENGSGKAVSLGLQEKIAVRVYTFGKAMGIHGACVVGSTALRNYLINFARPFIYTTALPPHSIVAIECAFEYLKRHIILQTQLAERITKYKGEVSSFMRGPIMTGAIQSIIIPGNGAARNAALQLQRQGFDIRAILSPTVTPGAERLRVCLHTFNSDEQITDFARALKVIVADL